VLPSHLRTTITQEDFGQLVGISQQRVGQLLVEGTLQREGTAAQWLLAYCERLREQAASRDKDLTTERAALARSQRVGQDLKNAVAQAEYAPIGVLGDVLAAASAAVVDRFDALPAQLRKACPTLPLEAREVIGKTIASARNEWIRHTAELVVQRLDQLTEDDADMSAEEEVGVDPL
jgi:phage terminase Nu1 subunit (DNA packaging protein)